MNMTLVDPNGMPMNMGDHNNNPNPDPDPNPNPNPNPIYIVDHYLPYDTHNSYDVVFYSDTIHTLLTSTPSFVDSWIDETRRLNRRPFLVGLDIEWRPNFHRGQENPVATLQLCVGTRCLVFQIIHAPYVPESLRSFLADSAHTFVGVGIENDVEKLLEDYSLGVSRFRDLRVLAAESFADPTLRGTGLKTLGLRVLGKNVEKPKRITRSKWDDYWLKAGQVQYATLDAFVSLEIGRYFLPNGF